MLTQQHRSHIPRLWLLASKENSSLRTHDGIKAMATRLADEVNAYVQRNAALIRPAPLYLTIVGHSLGGLIARYAVRLMLDPKCDKHLGYPVVPVSYMSVATPHLGSRLSQLHNAWIGLKHVCYRAVCTAVIGKTGKELYLADTFAELNDDLADDTESDRCLLREMARHDGPFIQTLGQFRSRIVVGHTHDRTVPICSATVRSFNPYTEIDGGKLTSLRILHDTQRPDASSQLLLSHADHAKGTRHHEREPYHHPLRLERTSFWKSISFRRTAIANDSAVELDTADTYWVTTNRFIHCSDVELEFDPQMLHELQETDFRRITIDYGDIHPLYEQHIHPMLVGKVQMSVIAPQSLHDIARHTASYLASVLIDDFEAFLVGRDKPVSNGEDGGDSAVVQT